MPVYQDTKTKTWYVKCYYTDYSGEKKQRKKRGFKLQREAKEWEHDFLLMQSAQPTMPFSSLSELFLEDKKKTLKKTTYITYKNVLDNSVTPYFKNLTINQITPMAVRKYSQYLTGETDLSNATIKKNMMLLSTVCNFAVKYYGLRANPCKAAGVTIKKEPKKLNFWTFDQFNAFISTFREDDTFRIAFMVLYYTGIRVGELMALTPSDITGNKLTITKTLQYVEKGNDVTAPKTPASNREILMPSILVKCLKYHFKRFYDLTDDTRLFTHTVSGYRYSLKKHAEMAGVPIIRTHDLRHSNASLLIELGFSALLVAERLGHENASMTLDIYSHLYPSKQEEVIERMDALAIK